MDVGGVRQIKKVLEISGGITDKHVGVASKNRLAVGMERNHFKMEATVAGLVLAHKVMTMDGLVASCPHHKKISPKE